MRMIRFFFFASLIFGLLFLSPLRNHLKRQCIEYLIPQKYQTIQPCVSAKELYEMDPLRLQAKHIEQIELVHLPLALFEIKYSDSTYTTHQGKLLWDLTDGEMIISSRTWKKTSGLKECLHAELPPKAIQLIKLCALSPQGLSLAKLSSKAHIPLNQAQDFLSLLIDRALIKEKNELYFVHLAHPGFPALPMTLLDRELLLSEQQPENRLSPKVPLETVQDFSLGLFDQDFSLLSSERIYLPVYRITVSMENGDKKIIEWNGWTNRPLKP